MASGLSKRAVASFNMGALLVFSTMLHMIFLGLLGHFSRYVSPYIQEVRVEWCLSFGDRFFEHGACYLEGHGDLVAKYPY